MSLSLHRVETYYQQLRLMCACPIDARLGKYHYIWRGRLILWDNIEIMLTTRSFCRYITGVWFRCLRWAFVVPGRRGTCFDSVCAKPGGLACRRLERCFIHTSDVLPFNFAHMSYSNSFCYMHRSSWNPNFERSANSIQKVCAVFQLGYWASPLMFQVTSWNCTILCLL